MATKKTEIDAPSPFTPEGMRERFVELEAQLREADKELAPLEKEQSEIANYRRDREVVVNGLLKDVHARRAEVSNEMALISRALSGKTGEPTEKAE